MNKLFAWLSGFRKLLLPPEVGAPEPVELVSYTTHYLASDGTERPSLAGATQRIEVETKPDGIIQTRLFSLEPECLIKTTSAGVDAAGQPYSSRVRYWPWGQEAEHITICVENGQRSVEHQLFLGNGDLSRHKKMVGKRMIHTFVYIPPRFAYRYEEQMPLYPEVATSCSFVMSSEKSNTRLYRCAIRKLERFTLDLPSGLMVG